MSYLVLTLAYLVGLGLNQIFVNDPADPTKCCSIKKYLYFESSILLNAFTTIGLQATNLYTWTSVEDAWADKDEDFISEDEAWKLEAAALVTSEDEDS